MKDKLPSIIAAAFGGASPSLLHLAMLLTGQNSTRFAIGTYCLGIIVWAFMGAMVGWIVYEKSLKKAFYLGVGLPAFIQASITNFSEANKAKSDHVAFVFPSLVQSAVASEPPTPMSVPSATAPHSSPSSPVAHATNRVLIINPAAQRAGAYTFRWKLPDGKIEEIKIASEKTNRLVLPPNVREITVQGDNFKPVKLPSAEFTDPTNRIELDFRQRSWSGFERAMGIREVKDFDANVKITKPSP